jgi:lysyl-tRNA synthetase class 2
MKGGARYSILACQKPYNRSETMSDNLNTPLDENEQIVVRRQKLKELRSQNQAYTNDFRPQDKVANLITVHGHKTKEELASGAIAVKLAGRIMTRRLMGKASFVHLQEASGKIQCWGHYRCRRVSISNQDR